MKQQNLAISNLVILFHKIKDQLKDFGHEISQRNLANYCTKRKNFRTEDLDQKLLGHSFKLSKCYLSKTCNE